MLRFPVTLRQSIVLSKSRSSFCGLKASLLKMCLRSRVENKKKALTKKEKTSGEVQKKTENAPVLFSSFLESTWKLVGDVT